MDTWVVAVNSAVVQDEWDAVQVSHLKEPGKEKWATVLWSVVFHQLRFENIILLYITGLNQLSTFSLFVCRLHCGSRPNFSSRPSKIGETAEFQEKKSRFNSRLTVTESSYLDVCFLSKND